MSEVKPIDCKRCGKRLKMSAWVRCYGYYFCDLSCVNKWEDERFKRK